MINPAIGVLKPDTRASGAESSVQDRSRSENCARMKELGFTVFRHINMYGEHFEIVSDPYSDGDCIAVHVISGNDPKIRTLRLPITIFVSMTDRFLKRAKLTVQ